MMIFHDSFRCFETDSLVVNTRGMAERFVDMLLVELHVHFNRVLNQPKESWFQNLRRKPECIETRGHVLVG